MAELRDRKIESLIAFCLGIREKADARALYDKHLRDIETVTPTELFLVMYEQLKRGVSVDEMLEYVDKLINVFYDTLSAYPWEKPEAGTFLDVLMQENAGLIGRLEAFKAVIKNKDAEKTQNGMRSLISELNRYHVHMQKLENILFPYLEKAEERYLGLQVLWALHDAARNKLKETYSLLGQSNLDERDFNAALGQLYFLLYGLVDKQELILFPAAAEIATAEEFEDMLAQSFDYGFAYIAPPERTERKVAKMTMPNDLNSLITETGSLSMSEIMAMMNTLPVDMTLIDANDKVKYFSKPKDRIFQRSPAIIGRDVRNCHPPKSVHIVERILDAFKQGKKTNAKFWIEMNGMFIVIQYFALRDENGVYLGTLEVSQEVSDIRALTGEQRLLDWQENE